VFAVIQSAMPEKLTFYASVLLAHVLLALFLSSCEELLVGGLQALKGISPPAESSGDNEYSTGFYFTFNWLNLTLGAGGMQFLLAVIFVVRDALNAFLAMLPPRTRVVFMRRYWHAQSAAEIAKDCGMSVSAVNTLLHRTRKQLEEHLLSQHIYL
jgi:hypothetical protein